MLGKCHSWLAPSAKPRMLGPAMISTPWSLRYGVLLRWGSRTISDCNCKVNQEYLVCSRDHSSAVGRISVWHSTRQTSSRNIAFFLEPWLPNEFHLFDSNLHSRRQFRTDWSVLPFVGTQLDEQNQNLSCKELATVARGFR